MARFFNTSGLCKPEDHYMLDPLRRLTSVYELIEDKKYFTIHAPRQTGKTTALHAFRDKINREGRYIALVFSCETASVTGEDFAEANQIIARAIVRAAHRLPESERPVIPDNARDSDLLENVLTTWAEAQTKPIVLFIDEIDSLADLTLISVLRQLRNGYQERPKRFPQSVALVGLKDVRDYRVKVRDELKSMGTASPFNIKDKSLTLRLFTEEEVAELYLQHTAETGQAFTPEALKAAYYYSGGQPWLVNALARECVMEGPKKKTTETVTEDDILHAKEQLILRRDTHLDSLVDKLYEDRVRRIIEPIMAGEMLAHDVLNDDRKYVLDLGLLVADPTLKIANPIYREIIPRVLNNNVEVSIPEEYYNWLDDEGKLDWPRIWDGFLEFWIENGDILCDGAPYHEVAPQLALMAFLQRFANDKGYINREYAIGRRRIDLLVHWPYVKDGKRIWQKEAVELKVRKAGKSDPLNVGLKQLKIYLDGLSLDNGTLIIFDRRPDLPPLEERVTREFMDYEDKRIQLIRA